MTPPANPSTMMKDIREGTSGDLIRHVFFYPEFEGGNPVVVPAPDEASITKALSHVWENVREGEAGEHWTVYFDWLTKEQFDALGEHDGW